MALTRAGERTLLLEGDVLHVPAEEGGRDRRRLVRPIAESRDARVGQGDERRLVSHIPASCPECRDEGLFRADEDDADRLLMRAVQLLGKEGKLRDLRRIRLR